MEDNSIGKLEVIEQIEWLSTLGTLTTRTQQGGSEAPETTFRLDARERFGFELTCRDERLECAVAAMHDSAWARVAASHMETALLRGASGRSR